MEDAALKRSIATRLRRIHKASGLTSNRWATTAGVSPINLSLYLHGRKVPNAITLYKLAKAAGVGIEDFFPRVRIPA